MNDNIEVDSFDADHLATKIADMWQRWDSDRLEWKTDKQELRQYLFATDTRKTSNGAVTSWNNSTVSPKLTQIRDNLHANYMAALFPSQDWFFWQSDDKSASMMSKRQAIEAYMRKKLKEDRFDLLVEQLVLDYIDYGNVIVTYDFVRDIYSGANANIVKKYVGPRAYRVSPNDVVFNPVASSFTQTPLIRRMLKSIGDVMQDIDTKPNLGYNKNILKKALKLRSRIIDDPEIKKEINLNIEGFGSLEEYLSSDMVELLEFWGDIYDTKTQKLHKNKVITVIDRRWIIRNEDNPLWTAHKPFYHCGWRVRSDNLWAQGPLDQLVGLQYRIDHLENLKADVFDLIAYPIIKVKGMTIESFEYHPGAEINCGDEGDVEFMRPDTTALNADIQIQELMNRMEELAGAPKQAMGIRTPGEKTKYEVQALENAAGRIFQHKVAWFEKNVIEPLLNGMLAEAARNFDTVEQIKVLDDETGAEIFLEVTKEDLQASGKLYPIGARHFAQQAKFVQELTQTIAAVQAWPELKVHMSAKNAAKALDENLGWSNYGLFKDHAMIFEQAQTQRLMNQVQEDLQTEQQLPVEQPEQ